MGQVLTQDTRICELTTPLGKDVLVFASLEATEGLSELFEYHIDCLSEEADIDFDKAIGQQCTLKIKMYGKEREFSGILVEARWLGSKDTYYSYRILLRPWLWLLSRTSDCRIFQDKKASDIIQEVFKERGFDDVEFKLTEDSSNPKLEYCVQYRETDLNFINRLMEQHGIYYFFKHERGKHTLVLADSQSSHSPIDGLASIPYVALTSSDRRKEQLIHNWSAERRFRTGKIELNDYNYQKPNAQMVSDAKGSEHYTRSEMEIYDYPGKYNEKSDGERYAKIRLQSEQALDHRRNGNGEAVNLFPGGLTKLERHWQDSQNIEYLVVRATHSFALEAYRSGSGAGGRDTYFGAYEFLPSNQPFRAPIVTRKPLIYGFQTAKVVTKDDDSSEEIDVEALGEIYVRFYWDRKKKRSCRLRVAQVWSGKRWGGQIIPRVGQEVVIEFLEGDPDRPLVIGTVYNDEYRPPYDLPSKKTIGGLKSDSTKNGGGGYNEWNFEDKKGSEKITVHAEKDHDVVVRDTETRTIGENSFGGASRRTTLKRGDDKLDIEFGGQHISMTMDQTVDAGTTITMTANHEIVLRVGASIIKIDPTGIMINAPTVTIQSLGPLALHGTPVAIG
jgi:type VI secretion system secreted protein VgrG